MKEQEGLDGYEWYEGQPKWPLRRILGTVVAAISIFIYALLFFRFCTAFSGGFGEQILLAGNSRELYPAEGVVRRFYPETGEDEDGTVQVQYVVALEDTDHFQFTLKIRKKAHTPAGENPGYRVILRRDRDGETSYHEMSFFRSVDSYGYRYIRCGFDGIEDAENSTLTLLVYPGDYRGESFSAGDAVYTATLGGSGVYSTQVKMNEDRFTILED